MVQTRIPRLEDIDLPITGTNWPLSPLAETLVIALLSRLTEDSLVDNYLDESFDLIVVKHTKAIGIVLTCEFDTELSCWRIFITDSTS
jgi:hypothetical protein